MHKHITCLCCICLFLATQAGNVLAAGSQPPQPPDLAQTQLAAEKGDAASQFALGAMYLHGQGVPKDPAKAAPWLIKAADQGYMPAQAVSGALYFYGNGVPRDDSKAAQMFKKLADRGIPFGQFLLGAMYLQGRGVDRDQKAGCSLLRSSADRGVKEAIAHYNNFCAADPKAQNPESKDALEKLLKDDLERMVKRGERLGAAR